TGCGFGDGDGDGSRLRGRFTVAVSAEPETVHVPEAVYRSRPRPRSRTRSRSRTRLFRRTRLLQEFRDRHRLTLVDLDPRPAGQLQRNEALADPRVLFLVLMMRLSRAGPLVPGVTWVGDGRPLEQLGNVVDEALPVVPAGRVRVRVHANGVFRARVDAQPAHD